MELMNAVIFRKYELLVKGDGKALGICNTINNHSETNETAFNSSLHTSVLECYKAENKIIFENCIFILEYDS